MSLAPPLQQVDRTWVRFQGRRLGYFGGCDYFRLASHPRVIAALHRGADRLGLNVAASRVTTGNHEIFAELEQAVARFFGAPAALLVASGYVSNIVVLQALAKEFQSACIDARSHPSLQDAARFLECDVVPFQHRSPDALAASVRRARAGGKILVLTDGMFSHDGSAAPLRRYIDCLPRRALLLVDDAHGAGVLGKKGRGTPEHEGVSRGQVIQTVSLSKAFGAYGGAILCSRALRERIIKGSHLFSGNTPLPLPMAAAALEAVRLLSANPGWRDRMNRNSACVKEALRAGGMDIPDHPAPIIAILPRDKRHAARLGDSLLAKKVYPSLIRYPGGPPAGYFRFMISSEHATAQLDALVAGLLSGDRQPPLTRKNRAAQGQNRPG